MAFRFILQPTMAVIAAIHDGVPDARADRSHFWTILRHPLDRVARLRGGLNATARIILLGLAMDLIYQITVFKMFYPVEALLIALLLAFVPYLLIRGLVVRVLRGRVSADRATRAERGLPGMADPHSSPSAARFEVRATADTHFGWLRTRLSIERTMMAWLRTAASGKG